MAQFCNICPPFDPVHTFVFFDNGVQQLSGLHNLYFGFGAQLKKTASTVTTQVQTSKTSEDGKDIG